LTDLTIPKGIKKIGAYAFYNCTSITNVIIPDSVTSIGGSAFYECVGLTSITIPDSVTSIGSSAFNSCEGLLSATIGNGVTSIGSEAFAWCKSLTGTTIGSSVTSIGKKAFYGCTVLDRVILPDVPPTTVGDSAFPAAATLYVTDTNVKSAYQASEAWSAYTVVVLTPVQVTFHAGTFGTGTMATQTIVGKGVLNANTFTASTPGYQFIGWNTQADGQGIRYSDQQVIIVDTNITLYAQWANSFNLTYKHSNQSNWYHEDETGHQECYELRVNGVIQGDMGAFTNSPRQLQLEPNSIIEVACTYYT
jgi:uncharacterized repeat protein (TIGR02543 family)